jgi:uncharacterized caspase-like protein
MNRTTWWATYIYSGFLLAICFCSCAMAGERVALIIGNSSYVNIPPLGNPNNDAKLISNTLRDAGFKIIGGGPQLNLNKASFRKLIESFGKDLEGAEVGLFYFAGHGVQVRGTNFLVPVDANPTIEADVDFQMVDINLVLRQMEGSGTKLNLVVLDACRNNPFGNRQIRSTASGLAQIQAPEGTLISYATQPGNVALDGVDGNSPYSRALAQTISRGGLDIFQSFNEVGLKVKKMTGGAQQPWVSSSPIDGVFYFSRAPDTSQYGNTQTKTSGSPPGETVATQPNLAALPGAQKSANSRDDAETRLAILQNFLGIMVAEINSSTRRKYKIPKEVKNGVVVTEVVQGSYGRKNGFLIGDALLGPFWEPDGRTERDKSLVQATTPRMFWDILLERSAAGDSQFHVYSQGSDTPFFGPFTVAVRLKR